MDEEDEAATILSPPQLNKKDKYLSFEHLCKKNRYPYCQGTNLRLPEGVRHLNEVQYGIQRPKQTEDFNKIHQAISNEVAEGKEVRKEPSPIHNEHLLLPQNEISTSQQSKEEIKGITGDYKSQPAIVSAQEKEAKSSGVLNLHELGINKTGLTQDIQAEIHSIPI